MSEFKTGVAYFGVRNPEFVKVDLQIIASLGYSHILHTFSESDHEYYKDSMEDIIQKSSDYGLKVYVSPWGVGRVFGGEAYSEFASRNPEACQKDNSDTPLVASCPNSKVFRQYMVSWIETVCSMEIETVFWDEPHFFFNPEQPDKWSCSCETCQKKYRQRYLHSMPTSMTESIEEFRAESLYEFLEIMMSEVHRHGKRNALCLHPKDHFREKTNWSKLSELPHLDEISIDPSWEPGARTIEITQNFHKHIQILKTLCNKNGKEAQVWIKNYSIQKNNEDSVVAASYAAFNEGIRNIFCWSYLGSKYLSSLSSADPEKVWALQTETFEQLKLKIGS